jgi:hypothetical protein
VNVLRNAVHWLLVAGAATPTQDADQLLSATVSGWTKGAADSVARAMPMQDKAKKSRGRIKQTGEGFIILLIQKFGMV